MSEEKPKSDFPLNPILEEHLEEARMVQRKRIWGLDNFWFWPREWQLALGMGTLTGFCVVANNWMYKRPWFAYAPRHAATVALFSTLGYVVGRYQMAHYKARDVILEHYISLHPEDFAHISFKNHRTFGDILLPWYPIRVQEKLPPRPLKSKYIADAPSSRIDE